MFAKRDIKKGEELFFNYHITKESFNDFKWARSGENAKLKIESCKDNSKPDKLKALQEKYLMSENHESESQFKNKELKYKRRKKDPSKNKLQDIDENEVAILNKNKGKFERDWAKSIQTYNSDFDYDDNSENNLSEKCKSFTEIENDSENEKTGIFNDCDFKINLKHVKLSKYFNNN